MAISSVATNANTIAKFTQLQNEKLEGAGPDNDGDADDKAMKAVKAPAANPPAAPAPTVNAQGQAIGAVINAKA